MLYFKTEYQINFHMKDMKKKTVSGLNQVKKKKNSISIGISNFYLSTLSMNECG